MALAKGGAITLLGSVGAYGLGMFFNLLVARRVGADVYGLYALGLTVITIAATFSGLGLARGAQRFIAIHWSSGDDARLRGTMYLASGLVFGAGVLTGAIVWILAPTLSEVVFHDRRLIWVIRLLSVAIPFQAAIDILSHMTQAFRVMRYKALIEDLLQSLLKLLVGIGLFAIGWRLDAVLVAWIAPTVITAWLMAIALSRIYPVLRRGRSVRFELRPLLRFSAPLHMSNVIRFMQGRTELLVLGAVGGAQVAGIYNISLRVAVVGALLVNAFIAITAPMITTLHHQGNMEELESLFKTVTRWLILVNLPLALTIAVLAHPLLAIFGNDFALGATALVILAGARLVDAATGIGGILINMVGRSDLAVVNSIAALVLAVVFDLILIPQFGLLGAAVAALLAIVSVNGLRLVEIHHLLGIHPYSRQLWKPAVAGVVSAAAALLASRVTPSNGLVALVVPALALWASFGLVLLALRLDETDAVITRALQAKLRAMLPARVRV